MMRGNGLRRGGSFLLKVRQLAENLKTCFDLVARDALQAPGAEVLDGKRSHHAAVEHGVLQRLACDLALRGDVAHESSGKGIPSARGIFHLVDRQSRSPERMTSEATECSFAEEDGRSILA